MKNLLFAPLAVLCMGALVACGDDSKDEPQIAEVVEQLAPEVIGGTIGTPVDLGLSVKWANHCLGLSNLYKEDEKLALFAWGEVETKEVYSAENYKWADAKTNKYTRNGKTVLDPEDDAAITFWGDDWRMPTDKELNELVSECEWTWTDNYMDSGREGYIVEGPNKKTIFIAASGEKGGYCFSNTLHTFYDAYGSDFVSSLSFTNRGLGVGTVPRYEPSAILPVYVGK